MKRNIDTNSHVIVVERSTLIREKLANLISRITWTGEVNSLSEIDISDVPDGDSDVVLFVMEAFSLIETCLKKPEIIRAICEKHSLIAYTDGAFKEMVRKKVSEFCNTITVIEISEIFSTLRMHNGSSERESLFMEGVNYQS